MKWQLTSHALYKNLYYVEISTEGYSVARYIDSLHCIRYIYQSTLQDNSNGTYR